MTQEKWDNIINKLKGNFELLDEMNTENDQGHEIEHYVFESPMGQVKLERTLKPKLLETKTNYSNRIGSSTQVDYIYSNNEFVDMISIYKWDSGVDDWVEMNENSLDLFS